MMNAAVLEVSGTSDVFLMSVSNAGGHYLANLDTTKLLLDPFSLSPIGMAFRKGNEDLVNKAKYIY